MRFHSALFREHESGEKQYNIGNNIRPQMQRIKEIGVKTGRKGMIYRAELFFTDGRNFKNTDEAKERVEFFI